MLIFAIDDEPAMLEDLHEAIAEAAPDAEIMDFMRAGAALSVITEEGKRPDIVFADIEMPGMNGLNLAVQIKNRTPETKIVFVTGFSQYALEAWQRRVNGYLMKPVDAAMIREELESLSLPPRAAEPDRLLVRCFGNFDVFWHGEPLIFRRTQAKELLAYLVDREGAACTGGEIIAALWGDGETIKNPKPYLRLLAHELRATLAAVGMEDVLIREHQQWAVRRERLDCDYYRMREGDPDAVNAYHGEYMSQYSWAELTAGRLHFQRG